MELRLGRFSIDLYMIGPVTWCRDLGDSSESPGALELLCRRVGPAGLGVGSGDAGQLRLCFSLLPLFLRLILFYLFLFGTTWAS